MTELRFLGDTLPLKLNRAGSRASLRSVRVSIARAFPATSHPYTDSQKDASENRDNDVGRERFNPASIAAKPTKHSQEHQKGGNISVTFGVQPLLAVRHWAWDFSRSRLTNCRPAYLQPGQLHQHRSDSFLGLEFQPCWAFCRAKIPKIRRPQATTLAAGGK